MNASVKLLESVLPATVALRVTARDHHPSTSILGKERRGTGTIIDSDGFILTVNYLVIGAETIEVTLLGGEVLAGHLVATDLISGLAIIAIDSAGLPTIALTTSDKAYVGQEVFIVAAADEQGRRASDGCITSLSPFDAYWEYSLDRAIVTSALNPGHGGGPIINSLGLVVGFTALDLNEVGRFTLGIPPDDFLAHRDELMQFGTRSDQARRAWIGFYCYTLRDKVVIAGVLPGSPGERAGLKAGDIVVSIDGQSVDDRRQLYTYLWTKQKGDSVKLRVLRDNDVQDVLVSTGSADEFFA